MTSRRAGIEDVRFAYRLLLGREPDAAGFETYSRLIREQVLQPDELARYFLGSNEFRSRISDHVREVDLGGFILSVDANDNDVSRVIAQSQLWEPHVTAVLNEKLRPGGSFLDVGANIGYFTAWAAHRVGSSGRVVAVEPMDKNVQLICSTIERNGFAHVRVEPFAASDGSGIARMGTLEGSSNGQIERAWASGMRPLYVQTRRLDDLLSDDKGFDVVKFDIEGHEPYALRGFSRGLERGRSVLLTEFHPRCLRSNAQIEPEEYAAMLFNYGVVTVLHLDGKRSVCSNGGALMERWAQEDALSRADGAAHLDLLVEPS